MLVIPLYVGVLILADKYDTKTLITYSMCIPTGLVIYMLAPDFWRNTTYNDLEFMVPFLFMAVLIAYHFIWRQKGTKMFDNLVTTVKWLTIPTVVVAALLIWVVPNLDPFNFGGRIATILNPAIRQAFALVASVGEQEPAPWSFMYVNTLIALLLVVPGVYFCLRRGNKDDILMIVFALTLLYFTGSMVRIVLVLAPALALLGGYALANILKYFGALMQNEKNITRRRKRQVKHTISRAEGVIVFCLMGFLLFVQVNNSLTNAVQQLGYPELLPGGVFYDFEQALMWMRNNLPGTSVVVSWWDYGYWITIVGNMTSVNDNATWNATRIGEVGLAMMSYRPPL